jgi:hypothetical protein
MTADGWQGPRRWTGITVSGGLLAVSLFGIALGMGLSGPQTNVVHTLQPPGIYQNTLPDTSCHINRTGTYEICVGRSPFPGRIVQGLPAHILATRAAIVRAFRSPHGHGIGSVTITAARYPRNFGWLATKGWIGLQGPDGTHWFKVPSFVARLCHLESRATSYAMLRCVVDHLTPAKLGSGPLSGK